MGASCTYSSHVKSHAAHSPRVDVRVRVMKNPYVFTVLTIPLAPRETANKPFQEINLKVLLNL